VARVSAIDILNHRKYPWTAITGRDLRDRAGCANRHAQLYFNVYRWKTIAKLQRRAHKHLPANGFDL